MKVPFLDLKTQYASIKDEIAIALQEVLDNTAFAGGPMVKSFEDEFARYCQCEHAIGVDSGTSALWNALLAVGVGYGDEVITVPNTFIATAEAISFTGAKPVFVDVDERSYTMNPELIEQAITPNTKAIIPVHLYGQMADMDPIMEIARRHGLYVIEDAAQAHGAEYKGRSAGSIGDAGCFSFYPGKNLGAYGEAGAVTTNNSAIAERIRTFRDHGQTKKYHHSIVGWNSRMDGFQGAILSVKLKHLPAWTESRRTNAQLYYDYLLDVEGINLPIESEFNKHVYHIYPIRTQERDELIHDLAQKEIFCGIHYPVPVHLTEAYSHLQLGAGSFPVAEKVADELVSLPMFAELNQDQISYVANRIKEIVTRKYALAV